MPAVALLETLGKVCSPNTTWLLEWGICLLLSVFLWSKTAHNKPFWLLPGKKIWHLFLPIHWALVILKFLPALLSKKRELRVSLIHEPEDNPFASISLQSWPISFKKTFFKRHWTLAANFSVCPEVEWLSSHLNKMPESRAPPENVRGYQ